MALDRIPAVSLLPPSHNRPGADGPAALAKALQVQAAPLAAQARLQAATEGLTLPQAGSAVLAAATPDPAAAELAAMQSNQVFFSRQVVWQQQDPAALAASWQAMVRAYGKEHAALLDQTRGQHIPASVFMTSDSPLAPRAGFAPPFSPEAGHWRFVVHAWGRQRLMLRVLAKDPEQRGASKRRRARIALRLESMVPGAGLVMIQMEAVGNGIVLDLAAPQPLALAYLRDMLPELAAAIARAGLTMVRCRRAHVLPPAGSLPTQAQAAALSLPMFEAMAAVAVLLMRPFCCRLEGGAA